MAPRPGRLEEIKIRKTRTRRREKGEKQFAFSSTISYPLRELAGR